MSRTPQGSGLEVPGKTPEERLQHRLGALENANQEDWRGETGWFTLTLQNGATTVGSQPGQCRLTGFGLVICRGYITNQVNTIPFLDGIPTAWRPGSTKRFVSGGGTSAPLDVTTSGQFIMYGGNNPQNVSIDFCFWFPGS